MVHSNYKIFTNVLWLLLFLFCFRVIAQLIVYFIDVPFLPSFEYWHSASIPYVLLVFSQLVIILIFARIALKFSRGVIDTHYRVGISLLVIGGVYFLLMLTRLVISLMSLSDLPWWNKPIPSFFHLVLAAFLLMVGWFHWRYGKKQ